MARAHLTALVPKELFWALLLSAVLFAIRWYLAHTVGFGDAEALYASYALHPQPAYVDHPGLVGLVARWTGSGEAPTPEQTHRITAIAATALPWAGALCARAAGASTVGALRTCFALALAPELTVGLFAMTPDLLLAFFWLAALGLSAAALRSDPGSLRALVATVGAGGAAGFACLSKATGALLALSLLVSTLARPVRHRWRTAAPWAALGLAALLVSPVVHWEHTYGWPMLRHRLIATQGDAGISVRNAGALLGGQLLYVTPPFLYAAWLVARRLYHRRLLDPIDGLLWHAAWLPGLFLALLCLWSRVAEPHWLAPAYLALTISLAREAVVGRRLGRICVATGAAVIGFAMVWVGTELPPMLLGSAYRPRYDITNDLYAWKPGLPAVRAAVEEVERATGKTPVIVGPHYIVCAQVHAGLGRRASVGCRTPVGDDFERWLPNRLWQAAPVLLFVQDDRFPRDPALEFPDHRVAVIRRVHVLRGGRVVRTVTVTRLELEDAVALDQSGT